MNYDLDIFLEDINSRLDNDIEQTNKKRWVDFLENRFEGDIYIPKRSRKIPPKLDWPDININDAIEDTDLMILKEFKTFSDCLADGDGGRTGIRCNYGTGIIPSLFGGDLFVMPYETNTLPSVKPLGSRDKIREIIEAGVPDIKKALCGKVFETAERFLEIFDKYPSIGKHVTLYHPDTQSPIDIAELLWGSDIFLAVYDDVQLLKDILELVTETYIKFMRAWFDLVPPKNAYMPHWNLMFKGRIMLREDSLMNLSPQTYVDLIRPHDQRIFDEFDGGCVHFCGRGDHYIEKVSELKGITAINMTQPECNDVEIIFRHTVDKGIKNLGLPIRATEGLERPLQGQVHCELSKRPV